MLTEVDRGGDEAGCALLAMRSMICMDSFLHLNTSSRPLIVIRVEAFSFPQTSNIIASNLFIASTTPIRQWIRYLSP